MSPLVGRPLQTLLVAGLFVLVGVGDLAAAHGEGADRPGGPEGGIEAVPASSSAATATYGRNTDAQEAATAWQGLTGLPERVLLGSGSPWRPLALDNQHGAHIFFDCPTFQTTAPSDDIRQGHGDYVIPTCPLRVIDQPNPFGSPMLAVHPEDRSQVAFFSLHGEVVSGGPTERSRTDGPVTTFTSNTHGNRWSDQPLYESPQLATGEFASGAFDSDGNIYVGYTWYLNDERFDPEGSLIWLVKAAPMDEDHGLLGREANVRRAYNWPVALEYDGRFVGEIHMERVDPASGSVVDDDNMSHRRLETASPRPPSQSGPEGASELAVEATSQRERIVAIWPVLTNGTNASTAETGFIDIAWSLSPQSEEWAGLVEEERIGPCLETGRPTAYDGKLYIPCVVGAGYDHRPRARIGDIDIWTFDPYTGKTDHVGFTGISSGKPMLTSASDGYMVLVTSGFMDEEPFATISFGWYGAVWYESPTNIATFLSHSAGGGRPTDARISAAALSSNYHTLLFIYHERHEVDPERTQPNPDRPPRPREYTKTVFAMNECDGVLAGASIPLGDGMAEFHQQAYAREPGIYNDLQDGLVIHRDNETREERGYFAINDYGSLLYGYIPVDYASTYCPVFAPPVTGFGAAVPQALSLGTGYGNLAGAGVGVLAAAMIGYLLTVKRRTAQYTTAEDK